MERTTMHTEKKYSRKCSSSIIALTLSILMILIFASCGGEKGAGQGSEDPEAPFESRERVDLSGYEGMEGYEGESMLVETSVAEAVKLINDKETFVVFFSFEDCPYCNALIPYLNKAAEEAGQLIGYIDTRKDPTWMNNMDIDDYDLVVKYFGDYLEEDEQGEKHLYTPDCYFIKNGKVVARHNGVLEGAKDPAKSLTPGQQDKLMEILADCFAKLK